MRYASDASDASLIAGGRGDSLRPGLCPGGPPQPMQAMQVMKLNVNVHRMTPENSSDDPPFASDGRGRNPMRADEQAMQDTTRGDLP